ncbi:MAG: hypothetical protein WCJ34_05405 [Alcaligenaceae bacterium]
MGQKGRMGIKLKWVSVLAAFLVTGCIGIDTKTSPKDTFVLPRAYQELYQLAKLQVQQCWSDGDTLPVKGQLDIATRTAQVWVVGGLGGVRYGQIDIRALDDKNSEISTYAVDADIWNRASVAAVHEALQFGVPTCSTYMPGVRAPSKK